MNAVALAQDVERELPEVYANFDLVVNSANPARYDVLKQMARDKGDDHWQCEAVPKFYARFMQHEAQTSSGE